MESDQTVQCDVLTHCAHLYMLCECSVHTSRRLFFLPATEIGPERRKNTNCQTAKNAKTSNFSSSNCYGPNLLTRTNATGFPVILNYIYRTPSRFEDRLDSRACGFLRMLVLFVVVIFWSRGIDLYSCWGFFTCSSCILLHSRSVWVKSGRWLSGCWAQSWFNLSTQCFVFLISFRFCCDVWMGPPRQSCHVQ